MGSSWEPRAGVSRHGNPYAGVGPWSANGPRKDGGSDFGMMILCVIGILILLAALIVLWPVAIVVGVLALIFVPRMRRRVAAQEQQAQAAALIAARRARDENVRLWAARGIPSEKICAVHRLSQVEFDQIVDGIR